MMIGVNVDIINCCIEKGEYSLFKRENEYYKECKNIH